MAQQTFEEIKAWDGTSGTGAEAREVIKQNFAKVNDGFQELEESVTSEAIARTNSDNTLQANITAEALTRSQADATLAAAAEMALVLGLD